MTDRGFPVNRRGLIVGGAMAGGALSLGGGMAAAQSHGAPTPPKGTGPLTPDEITPKVMPALTAYIADAQTATVPEAVRERARLHILDTLASIIACRELEAAVLGRAYAVAQTGGAGARISIIGSRDRAGVIDAAFAGAMAGHAAEINDFIPSALVQPGPPVVSSAFALAQARGLSGKQLLNAVIPGYELTGRIPKALGRLNLQRASMANHGVGPTFGVAAMAASLIGLTPDQVQHVLSYSVQQASGSWQWMLDVRHVEKAFVFAAMGARNGLQSALMVEAGFTGVPDCLDQPQSWLRGSAFGRGDSDHGALIDGLGERFELSQAAMKRYPTGGPTQASVEAMLAMRKEVRPEEVTRVLVEMPGTPATFAGAAMPALNIPYLASIIMLYGQLDFVGAQSLERMRDDKAAAEFAKRVELVYDKKQDTGHEARSARVTIERRNGKPISRFVPYVSGLPDHPMDRNTVEQKARELVEPQIGARRADELILRTAAVEEERDVTGLLALTTV